MQPVLLQRATAPTSQAPGEFKDITLDKAELIAAFLEAVLFGFEALIFVATVYLLHGAKRTKTFPLKFGSVVALFLLNTIHIGTTLRRMLNAFVGTDDDPIPDAAMYLADLSGFLYRFKNVLLLVQFFMLDVLIIYRCYMIWDKKLVTVVLPSFSIAIFLASSITATVHVFATGQSTMTFTGTTKAWISASFCFALLTKLVCLATVLAATVFSRPDSAWQSVYLRMKGSTTFYKCVLVGIESGGLAVLGAVILIPVYLSGRNTQGIMLATMSPLTGLSFLIIITATLLGLTPSTSGPSRRRKAGCIPNTRITIPPISVSPATSPTSRFSTGSFAKAKSLSSSKSSASPCTPPDSEYTGAPFSKMAPEKTAEPAVAYTESRYTRGYVRGEPLPFSNVFVQRERDVSENGSRETLPFGDGDSLHISVSSRHEANSISRSSISNSSGGVFHLARSADGTVEVLQKEHVSS